MGEAVSTKSSMPPPAARDIIEVLKPITWFPPMWAFMCGVVSSGAALDGRWLFLVAGVLLCGPLVCGTSQVVNDWFDRHVDAINEPHRPIPSGRIAGNWGLRIAIFGTIISLLVAWPVGQWVFVATVIGLACAWGYSAPPLRFKKNGWLGPAVVGFTYEGLAWFTGASVMLGSLPPKAILVVLGLYSLGAHGIMTLNDFKAVKGDKETGLRSLPATLGIRPAAKIACFTMATPQLIVILLLFSRGLMLSASAVGFLLVAQCALMPRLISNPIVYAKWYSATGVTLYVIGMLATALGLAGYLS